MSLVVDVGVAALALISSYLLKRADSKRRYPVLKVERLFVYPIKSLPPISVKSVKLTQQGFEGDRQLVLVSPQPNGTLKPHLTSEQPQNSLIIPSFDEDGSTLTVTSAEGATYSCPLRPSTTGLKSIEIDLHQSPVKAFDLGDEAAAFFSRACSQETRLAFIEPTATRKVLGSISQGVDNGIAFQDCASYMVATTASLDRLSTLLGRPMPIVPLRPNVLLAPAPGAELRPWVEDYWSKITIGAASFSLTSNCVRCTSLNLDYNTGRPLTGPNLPFAALSKERRVDVGTPYSPVFGRYGFSNDVGAVLSVGDTAAVEALNKDRTVFDWPGM